MYYSNVNILMLYPVVIYLSEKGHFNQLRAKNHRFCYIRPMWILHMILHSDHLNDFPYYYFLRINHVIIVQLANYSILFVNRYYKIGSMKVKLLVQHLLFENIAYRREYILKLSYSYLLNLHDKFYKPSYFLNIIIINYVTLV